MVAIFFENRFAIATRNNIERGGAQPDGDFRPGRA